MAHELIVTSAKQGLEGISGDQAVLRSAGMPPQLPSRLKTAGGYSHPFPHGDSRNPVVYVHRIEEAAGKTWHVLGCIRDVGSDHTGRSNFLAHMVAADQAEVRTKKGGPAEVMVMSGMFRDSWGGPPDGAALPKILAAKDEAPQPGSCPAWTAAGLDPGLAGDLAAYAAAGKPVVLVTRPSDDGKDKNGVLAMFRDALKLVPPEKRWSVTFNTCAIESFNGIWTAIRDDLPQARGLRDSRNAVVIDLTKAPRGSDDPYARFARGEAEALPWQPAAKPRQAAATEAGSEAGLPLPGTRAGTIPPPVRQGADRTRAGGFRGGLDRRDSPIFIPPPEESRRRRWVVPVVSVVLLLLVGGGLAAYVMRDSIMDAWRDKPAPNTTDVANVPKEPSGPTPEEMARAEEEKRTRAIADAREQLSKAWGGRTSEDIRTQAEGFVQEVEKLRKGTESEPGLKIVLDGGRQPKEIADGAIAAAERAKAVTRQTEDGESFVADVEAAAKELAAAIRLLDTEVKRVPEIAKAEREALNKKMESEAQAASAKTKRDAFAAFKAQGDITEELPPPGGNADDWSGKRGDSGIKLGAFPVPDLVAPVLRLAVPEETINGVPFAAEIAEVEPGRWEVRVTKGFSSIDGKPVVIAKLAARDGMLVLEVNQNRLDPRLMAILRRCVILAEAQHPEEKQPQLREIRLVQPTKIGLLQVTGASGPQSLDITPPPGIGNRDTPPGSPTALNLKLPVSGIEVKAELNGRQETFRLPEQAAPDRPGIVNWPGVSLCPLSEGVTLELKVDLTLPDGTLKATPVLAGTNASRFNLETLAEFQSKHASKLSDVEEDFGKRVKACPGRDFKKARGTPTEVASVNTWFDKKLAPSDWLPLALPGHNTFAASIGAFLGEEYAKQARSLRDQWEREVAAEKDEKKKKEKQDRGPPLPDFPKDFADWQKRCGEAKEQQWPREFTARLDAWADWVWPMFESHWETTTKMARGLNQPVDVKLLEIVSIARDAKGNPYRVPLVVFDPNAPVTSPPAAGGGNRAAGAGDDGAKSRQGKATGL